MLFKLLLIVSSCIFNLLLHTVLLYFLFVGMNMEEVSSESSSPSNITSDQLSYSILNNCSMQIRVAVRTVNGCS